MRNLKRALSLVIASVMLLGMMVIGTSAAGTTFTDDRQIVNSETAAITGGLGIFSGYADGSFGAKNVVTRAEMATIVVKMLYGADYNADPFKGTGKFSDVADYQGGWAEGYVNLCASLGIIKGYGDGTFKPGQTLTTAEAITFIINALGIDAGNGDWPVTVMSKATELGLFGKLTPVTDAGMTRDDLSVLVYEGLTYSKNAGTIYTVGGIEFDSANDAALFVALSGGAYTTSDIIKSDDLKGSLAEKVFNLKKETIVVTGNATTEAQYKGDTVKTTEGVKWADRNLPYADRAATAIEYYIDTPQALVGCVADVYWNDKNGDGAYQAATEKVYAIYNQSKTTILASALDKQTPAQVQTALGLKNAPAVAAAKTPFYFFSYNDISGTASADRIYNTGAGYHQDVFTVDTGKLDVLKGTYTTYNGELVSFFGGAGRIVAYYLDNPTKGDGKFTLYDENDYCLVTEYAAAKASPAGRGPIVVDYTATENYKVVSNLDSLELDQKDSGYYVYITNYVGEFRSLAAPTMVTGTMEAFSMNTTANAKITISGTQYNVQPTPYDDDILVALKNSKGNAKHLAGTGTGSDASDPKNSAWLFGNHETGAANFATEYEFFTSGSYVWAYREKATAAAKKTLVVPVYKYTETTTDTSYGNSASTTTHWVQAVDTDGKEVILQVTETEYNTLTATAGVIDTKAFYTYTTSYNTSLKATVADFTAATTVGAVATAATKLSKSVSDGTNAYYFTDGFEVLYISGYGKTLKVTVKAGTYEDLTVGANVYGEKAKSTDSFYGLKYKLVDGTYSAGPEAGNEIIYMAAAPNMANTKGYKDAAGNTYTGYFQTAYIDGVKDTNTIFLSRDEIREIGGALPAYKGAFYTYTKDPVTGTYDLSFFTGNEKYSVALCKLVTRNANGLISIAGIDDMDVSEADFVNLVTSGTTASIKDPAKLTTSNKISVLYDKTTGKAEIIFVIA